MSTMPYDTAAPDEDWAEDGYAVSPEPVSPGAAPVVSPAVSRPDAPVVAFVVSPGDDDAGSRGNDGPPLGVGQWAPEPGETSGRRAGPGLSLRRLRAAAAGSELLGGGPGGLLAELADPHPETMLRHWEHVAGHPWRPDDRWGGAAFVLGHLAVTGPAKAAGKFLTAIGTALVFAGTRADWAGDRFIRTAIPLAIAVTLIIIILVFA